MQKPDLSKITKNTTKEDNTNNDNDALFEMDGLDEATDKVDRAPRTFAATQLGGAESEAHQVVQKISAHNDFRPIETVPSNQDEVKPNGGNGKKKRRRQEKQVQRSTKESRRLVLFRVSLTARAPSSAPLSPRPFLTSPISTSLVTPRFMLQH